DLGTTLVHIVAGDPGKVDVVDYEAKHLAQAGKDPVWYTHVLQSLDLLSGHPHVTDQQVADIPAYRWTASEMMGICADASSLPGGSQGATFSRGGIQGAPGSGCLDKLAPLSRVRGRIRATRRGVRLGGVSVDRGCISGRAGRRTTRSLRLIRVAIGRRLA